MRDAFKPVDHALDEFVVDPNELNKGLENVKALSAKKNAELFNNVESTPTVFIQEGREAGNKAVDRSRQLGRHITTLSEYERALLAKQRQQQVTEKQEAKARLEQEANAKQKEQEAKAKLEREAEARHAELEERLAALEQKATQTGKPNKSSKNVWQRVKTVATKEIPRLPR